MSSNYLYFIFFLCLSTHVNAQSNNKKFTKQEVIEDLNYLYESLQDAHYDLYAYTPKETLDSVYTAVKSSVDEDSLSLLEATNTLQQLITAVKNGHTQISFPAQSYIEYADAGGTLFPLEVALEDGKTLIRKNFSTNDEIQIGSELLSINGMPITEILSRIYPQISAERPYFKNVKLEFYTLPRYYWQVFGQQDDFEVETRLAGVVRKHNLKAISVIEGYEMVREDILNATMKLAFFENVAYLNPGGFDGDEEKYRHFIDSAFVEIKKRNSKNLIIDLKNNPGGNDPFSDYLVSYIADKPFKWNSSYTFKTSKFLKAHTRANYDTTSVFWQNVLNHKDGEVYEYAFEVYQPQPLQRRFEGDVYVLINRHSHSQSAVTAAQIQDYNFGTIVGEETGDYPSLYASIFEYPLPNTAISVQVSKGYMVRVNGSTKEEGVIPDIFIKDHLLDENDEILDGVLKVIDEK